MRQLMDTSDPEPYPSNVKEKGLRRRKKKERREGTKDLPPKVQG